MRQVSRVYPAAVPVVALDRVDLDVRAGDLTAVVGPSGSGKSTLLGLLGLLDRPTAGTFEVAGHDMSGAGDLRRTRLRAEVIGFVFQQFHLIGHLDAQANVETALLYRGLRAKERRGRALAALDRVGLAERAGHRPAELSGGEQQRVAIARALVSEPRLVLADEPTGALDTANAANVVDLLRSIVDGDRGVVVVTHDLDVAGRADRRIHMLDGRIVGDTLAMVDQ